MSVLPHPILFEQQYRQLFDRRQAAALASHPQRQQSYYYSRQKGYVFDVVCVFVSKRDYLY